MKKNLYIIGAGSFGRELESWLDLIPEEDRDWQIAGYLDGFLPIGKLEYPSSYEVVGNPDSFEFKKSDYVLLSMSNAKVRQAIFDKLRGSVTFYTYIAPNAIIGKFNVIGEGTIICPNCIITTNVKIGEGVIINIGSQIGHDCVIGDFCSIMANVDIAGKCTLKERVFVGSNVVIIPERTIGKDTLIGAGSVVIRNFSAENITIFGNPAQKKG